MTTPPREPGLTLVRRHGVHEGIEATWLRPAAPDGALLPPPWEAAASARAEVERERQCRAELEARITELESQARGRGDTP